MSIINKVAKVCRERGAVRWNRSCFILMNESMRTAHLFGKQLNVSSDSNNELISSRLH